jgi:SAM-dependent methyltransferase
MKNHSLPTCGNGSAPESWLASDEIFDRLYPEEAQPFSQRHWTPLQVTRRVLTLLGCRKGSKILDIGSGTGKFCLAASLYRPDIFLTGVEQRESLVKYAESARQALNVTNTRFVHANFTQLVMGDYDHFYYYNSFFENLSDTGRIDNSIAYSEELFAYYAHYLKTQLDLRPPGTRLVTFHSLEEEIPDSFEEIDSDMGRVLKCWEKK